MIWPLAAAKNHCSSSVKAFGPYEVPEVDRREMSGARQESRSRTNALPGQKSEARDLVVCHGTISRPNSPSNVSRSLGLLGIVEFCGLCIEQVFKLASLGGDYEGVVATFNTGKWHDRRRIPNQDQAVI
jgi:hypothetical protein